MVKADSTQMALTTKMILLKLRNNFTLGLQTALTSFRFIRALDSSSSLPLQRSVHYPHKVVIGHSNVSVGRYLRIVTVYQFFSNRLHLLLFYFFVSRLITVKQSTLGR